MHAIAWRPDARRLNAPGGQATRQSTPWLETKKEFCVQNVLEYSVRL